MRFDIRVTMDICLTKFKTGFLNICSNLAFQESAEKTRWLYSTNSNAGFLIVDQSECAILGISVKEFRWGAVDSAWTTRPADLAATSTGTPRRFLRLSRHTVPCHDDRATALRTHPPTPPGFTCGSHNPSLLPTTLLTCLVSRSVGRSARDEREG
jgi:hypothetical protein